LLILSLNKSRDKGKTVLPGSGGWVGERRGGEKGRGGGKGGEMSQTLYAHMNKRN
jgi:hypothetical protein